MIRSGVPGAILPSLYTAISHQLPYDHASTRIARAAHEYPAPQHWRLATARRYPDEINADNHIVIWLHIPQCERSLEDIDAVAMRLVALIPCVCGGDVKTTYVNMTSSHVLARKNLHPTGRDYFVGFLNAPAW